jgi:hypothetical protein
MPRHSTVKMHPRKAEIEVAIATGISLISIADRFGLSAFSLSRHRQYLNKTEPDYFRALKKIVASRPGVARLIRSSYPKTEVCTDG